MKTLLCAPLRTPVGGFQGSLSSFTAPQLGAKVLKGVLERSQVSPEEIQEVLMGCVLTAGLGQAPARQAALGAGLPKHVPCTTIGKVCGSGLKSVMLADRTVRAGDADAILAGGMESMSNTPYLLPKIRTGLRMGNGELVDSMIKDGLWDVYNDYHMGNAAELCSSERKISREAQDAYAAESYKRAQAAQAAGAFKDEMLALDIVSKKGTVTVDSDEEVSRGDPSKFASLKPAFQKDGTVTAANASTLSDGAAAVLACSEGFATRRSLKPFARIVAQAEAAQAPEWFTTAPAIAIQAALKKAGLKAADIDAWEINEAFACVAIANVAILEIDPAKVNPRGGAISIGHPIGASGARILATLCHHLAQTKKRYGCASLCIGGGEAVAVIVENLRL
jgi:acetyl-CoA C-acetyltransferase